jgi:hypothetical protein
MVIESAEEFVRLRTSERPEDYLRAAREPASPEVWNAVIDDHPGMRFWVAQNKTVPHAVLERLAVDPDPRVRWMVARKRKAGAALLAALAVDPDPGVRVAVAENRRTPDEILARLRDDEVPEVARAAER